MVEPSVSTDQVGSGKDRCARSAPPTKVIESLI
jgi:hypothetical protein